MTNRDRQKLVRWQRAIALARLAIDEALGAWQNSPASISGAVECPLCGGAGSLLFVRGGRSGRIVAMCERPECLCFAE